MAPAAGGPPVPTGRPYRVCHRFRDGVRARLIDVWESHASFEAFGARLMPLNAKLGSELGEPSALTAAHTFIIDV